MNDKTVRIQDDLYHAVNDAWLEKATIPDDRPTAGGFAELDQDVEKTLMADFRDFASEKKSCDIPEMKNAISLYRMLLQQERRNEEGIKPLLPLLHEIESIKTVEELNRRAKELSLLNVDLPFNFGVEPDMKDATKHSFIVVGPDIILPDTSYYDEKNPAKEKLLALWSEMVRKLLRFTDLSSEDQERYLQDALAFDALVAKKVKSQLEWANYVDNYNPMPTKEVCDYLAPFDLDSLLKDLYGEKMPKEIIVYDPKATREMKDYFSVKTFPLYLHWAYIRTLIRTSSFLSEEISEIGTSYRRALTGVKKDPVLEKRAYQTVSRLFSEPIGVYYGRTYFGEAAKKDVIEMVKRIIEMYKKRMAENAFLKESTKEKAILKLNTIVIKMGYPDKIDPYYARLTVDENDTLLEAMGKLTKCMILHNLMKLNLPVDRTEWGMPGHLVNACYNPLSNDITFPAAILQKPFYSLQQSVSENLGGIGAVIGHEISHAFDNNGAQFDEKGNLADWWTKEDYAAFQALTKRMIEEFDGIDYCDGKVNGELIVSENIADNGGMGVTLGIMHTLEHPDFQAYFRNWGRIWCMKAKEEYVRLLLTNDVHAPTQLRANMQPRNFPEWYAAFDVKEGDGMYLAPEKRVTIW